MARNSIALTELLGVSRMHCASLILRRGPIRLTRGRGQLPGLLFQGACEFAWQHTRPEVYRFRILKAETGI
jgi:hypothetical protein